MKKTKKKIDKRSKMPYRDMLNMIQDRCQQVLTLKSDTMDVLFRLKKEARAMGTELAVNKERMESFMTLVQGYARQAEALGRRWTQLETKAGQITATLAAQYEVVNMGDAEYRELIATQRSRIDNLENEIRASVHNVMRSHIEGFKQLDLTQTELVHRVEALDERCNASVVSHVLLWTGLLANMLAAWFFLAKPY